MKVQGVGTASAEVIREPGGGVGQGPRSGSRVPRLDPERLLWAVRVRWLVLGGFLLLGVAARAAGLFRSIRPLLATAAIGAAMNTLNGWCVGRRRGVAAVSAVAIPLDHLLITTLVVSTGGVESPFVVLYFVQVLATAMLVDTTVAAAAAVLACGLWVTALSAQSAGSLGMVTAGDLLEGGSELAHRWLWASCTLYCLGLLVYLGGYISGRLRISEHDLADKHRRLQLALRRLEITHGQLQEAYGRLQATESQLIHAEKMRSLGQLVAGVAHELNNPLSFVVANLQLLRGALCRWRPGGTDAPEPVADSNRSDGAAARVNSGMVALLDDCEEGARRAVGIVAELRTFSRTDEREAWQLADLQRGLESTLAMLAWRCAHGVAVHRDFGTLPLVECLPGQLNQVFMNLLSNALDAIGARRGNVWVATGLDSPPRHPNHVCIRVRDDGCGMSDAVRTRACEPFYTTKPVGRGTGLGLSVSFAIVARHGGTLRIESAPGAGTTVTVVLPLRRARTPAETAPESVD